MTSSTDHPYAGGGIGRDGYDLRTGEFLAAGEHYDFMSYCKLR